MSTEPLFSTLSQRELNMIARKMRRVINDPRVPDYAWQDAEEIYQETVREAFRRWNAGRWKK